MKILFFLLLSSTLAFSDCQNSLSLCNNYVNQLKADNLLIQEKSAILLKQRDDLAKQLEAQTSPTIPTIVWVGIGVLGGLALGLTLRR